MRAFDQNNGLSRLVRGMRWSLVGGAVCMAPTAFVRAESDDIASSVVDEQTGESSVVVAKRKLEEPSAPEDESADSLQPISTLSDREPRLADPEPTLAPSGATEIPVKVASNTSEVSEVAAADSQAPRPAVFHGIQPGISTKKQLIDTWGSPDEVAPTETGQLYSFNLESFRGVEVLIEDGLVTLMKVNLRAATPPEELAAKVQADSSEAVQVTDPEVGRVAAFAYPERGIVMVVDEPDDITPESTLRVSQLILQPLDAETFCLRSEGRPESELALRLSDLRQATALAPRDAHAHWLLARVLLDAGRASEGEAEAKRAVDLDAENMAYRQRWGEALAAVGRYDDAVLATREVLDADNVPTLIRGQAMYQMGALASMGDASIADKAVGFHNLAIVEADKLATSDDVAERRAAKRLLVDAHLAIANEVARSKFDDKMSNVAQWVSRASAFAEEMIENDGGDLSLRIRVAQQSLTALTHFKPANDPEPLIQEINESLEEVQKATDDPLWIDQLEWIKGLAYLDALQIEHHRRRPKQALAYSKQAMKLLAEQAEDRRDNPQTERLVGKLYFHIGAVHAVHQSEHAEAVDWYDRAFPLLVTEENDCELVVPRHEGEALVSMAVSYWDQNDRRRAISLTEMGADLIEQAVTGGVLEKENLAVPYGNLAVMHKKLGNNSESQRYAKLAESVKKSDEPAAAQAEVEAAPVSEPPGVAAAGSPQTAQRGKSNPGAQRKQMQSPSRPSSPNRRNAGNRTYRR